MTVIVLGASGMLGRDLCRTLAAHQIPYVGTYDRNPIASGVRLSFDRGNPAGTEDALEALFSEHTPTTCINCVVQRFVDVCERCWADTKFVNTDIVGMMARVCARHGTHLIQVSTDYVFDGASAPFSPVSAPNPLQNYGISKLVAELRVKAYASHYTIVRVPVIYTDRCKSLDESAVTAIAKKVMNRAEQHQEDAVSIRRPLFIQDLCAFIVALCAAPAPAYAHNAVLHFSNPHDKVTKHQMARAVGTLLGKSTDHIAPQVVFADSAARPHDTELIDAGYARNAFHYTPLLEGLAACLQRFIHPKLSTLSAASGCLLLFDLDGTLLDSERAHYAAYKAALEACGAAAALTYARFLHETHVGDWPAFLLDTLCASDKALVERVVAAKEDCMTGGAVTVPPFVRGADVLLATLLHNGVPFAIVTNTSRRTVEWYTSNIPLLNQCTRWITKEDVAKGKPDPECYQLARARFGQGCSLVIGFENTVIGYQALRGTADIVYIVAAAADGAASPSTPVLKKEDVYLIQEYSPDI